MIFANRFLFTAPLACLAMAATLPAQTTPLFQDDFNAANGTSLTDPATRATGTLASTVKYAWTNTTQVVVDGTLNWDSNNSRDGQHQQADSGASSQNFRMTYNWAPQVAGRVWEVEFDQRVGWSHPLTFGLSDNSQNGNWDAWNSTSYDFAVGAYGISLHYDTDNDDGVSGTTNDNKITGVFPALVASNPPSNQTHRFRIRFNEPAGTATVWINGAQQVQVNSLDFENSGRYLSWGEPTLYGGALDNITVGVVETPPAITSTNPADNATLVPVGTNLTATFNEDIALTGTGTVTLRDLGPGPDIFINLPDPQVSISGTRNLVVNPSSDLLPNNSYAVWISADAIRDLAPVPNTFTGISSDATWDFSTSGPPPVGPNVIVYLMDDLGLTDVQQHPTYFPDGSPLFETPNMHRLASQGMRFNYAYAQPLCSASRSCLLSGQDTAARNGLYMAIVNTSVPNPALPTTSAVSSPYNHPTDRDHMPLAVETIAERLKAAGYATWHAGKWHLSPEIANTAYYPDKQGFDKQLGVGGSGPSSYFGPFSGIPNLVDYNGDPAPGAKGDHISNHMAKLVQNMIDNHLATDPARPFFLYYPAYSVHGPHEARKSLFNKYQAKLAGLPNSKHRHPVMAAQIEMADKELGSMMDYLDAKGLTNNTLFIFLSDNGGLSITYESGSIFDDIGTDGIPDDAPNNVVNGTYAKTTAPVDPATRMSNMDPRRAGKGSLFEGGMRIPMIIKYPNGGIAAAAATNEPVRLMDIYQTILDYTPTTAKPGYPLDGVSLKPALEQTGSLPDRDLFIHFPRNNETWGTLFLSAPGGYPDPDNYPFTTYPGGTAMIRYPYKMIARYSTAHDAATVNYQLYRLDLDVGETTNVAGKYPEVVDAMRRRLVAYYQNTGALVPTRNPNYNGTSLNSPETTAKAFLAAAGLTPNTPQTFLLADPDLDGRRNEDEFLRQTNPKATDASVATTWLYNNGSFDELRFAIPANVSQSSFQILDANGTVAFTPTSGLTLDGQYGPFYVYKPTSPQPGGIPGNYRIALVTPSPGTPVTPDADGDGLPDTYENSNGLNPNNVADGQADNDGDGMTRGQEYLAGTNDFDSNDILRLQCVGQPDAGGSLRFNIKDQKAYRLHKSANLANWTLWEDFGVISGNHEAVLPLSKEGDRQFYRLEACQP